MAISATADNARAAGDGANRPIGGTQNATTIARVHPPSRVTEYRSCV